MAGIKLVQLIRTRILPAKAGREEEARRATFCAVVLIHAWKTMIIREWERALREWELILQMSERWAHIEGSQSDKEGLPRLEENIRKEITKHMRSIRLLTADTLPTQSQWLLRKFVTRRLVENRIRLAVEDLESSAEDSEGWVNDMILRALWTSRSSSEKEARRQREAMYGPIEATEEEALVKELRTKLEARLAVAAVELGLPPRGENLRSRTILAEMIRWGIITTSPPKEEELEVSRRASWEKLVSAQTLGPWFWPILLFISFVILFLILHVMVFVVSLFRFIFYLSFYLLLLLLLFFIFDSTSTP
ncbi:hypothetical protein VTN77DRAFT_1659 [Rasamsonia byssochlamydoides]|uniref:uncharacterized protein n=1 Tax=Rasamsonia byssochlamydoides TaxID=89139 RepID=UPI003742620F